MPLDTKITSKGQITLPVKIRRELGLGAGDHLRVERDGDTVRLLPMRKANVFEEFRGIGTPGIGPGLKAVLQYVRDLRGHDDLD